MSDLGTRLEAVPGSPYRILGAIHRGGMGEILLARAEGAEGFSRKLVLKGLLPQLAADLVSHDLFRREAMIMARLEHPNIVRVVDFTSVDGQPFLAMEYIRGRNFHQVIQRAVHEGRRVPLRIALAVVGSALRGLHYAHHARDPEGKPLGIVHRDVSPGNILVSFFGEVKVTDFGIAFADGEKKHTAPRTIRGKARYTAPEIIAGRPATLQSDVFAAGIVLAEALLGKPLFERGGLNETLMAIVSESREALLGRIFAESEEVQGLRAILRASLAKRPDDRFASALQMADAIAAVERASGSAVTPPELGAYMRDAFRDARDLPSEEGLAAPAVVDALFFEPKTDPTLPIPVERLPRPSSAARPSRGSARGPLLSGRREAPSSPPVEEPQSVLEIVEVEGDDDEPTAAEPRSAIVPPPRAESPRLEIVEYLIASDEDVIDAAPIEAAFSELEVGLRRASTDSVRAIMPSVPPRAAAAPLLKRPIVVLLIGIFIGGAAAIGASAAVLLSR
ncbi:MAG: serine/threonine protein kinase [Deltaproteobacteria bacterium]|nr:serine/threonine protein kinase [Deltaproteobacteria bacterium]